VYKYLSILGFVFLLFLGLVPVLATTQNGVGISPDSVAYIGGARQILAGKGFTEAYPPGNRPMTHFAPVYSIVLAAFGLISLDPQVMAKWLNAGLFLATGAVTGIYLVHRLHSKGVVYLSGLAIALAVPLRTIYSMAWTEPLFIFLMVCGFLILNAALESKNNPYLVISALLLGLCAVVRYAGLVFVPIIGTWLLIFTPEPFYGRIRKAALGMAISLLPSVLWWSRNYSLTGWLTDRRLAAHPISPGTAAQVIHTITHWIIPTGSSSQRLAVLSVAVLVLGLLLWRSKSEFRIKLLPLETLLIIFCAAYVLFLFVSISFFDAQTPLDDRVLSPLYFPLLILAALFLDAIFKLRRRGITLPILLSVLILSILQVQSITRWAAANREGFGYDRTFWNQSLALKWLRSTPVEAPIYSNAPDLIYFKTQISTYGLPVKQPPSSLETNPQYPAEMQALAEAMDNQGLLIFFSGIGRSYMPGERELQKEFGLVSILKDEMGSVYGRDGGRGMEDGGRGMEDGSPVLSRRSPVLGLLKYSIKT
jgi:type IV secretory pathway VirB2 component (pilin)